MATLDKITNLLTPSFLSNNPPAYRTASPSTAHLDGLRGLASFIVILCHTAYSSHDLSFGYGYIGERSEFKDTYRSPWRLPFIRLFYNGDMAVAMFFLISGFAISWKPLRLARKKDWDGFARALMSSSIRRFIRLFLPVAVSTGMICLFIQLRAYEPTRGIANDGVLLTAFREPHPEPKSNIFVMAADWIETNYKFWQFFHWDKDFVSVYDIHLWTIPVELRASLSLFATLLAVAGMKPRARQVVLAILILVAVHKDCWGMMLFFAGALEADMAIDRGEDVSSLAIAQTHEYEHTHNGNGQDKKQDSYGYALPTSASQSEEKKYHVSTPQRSATEQVVRLLLWPPILFLMSQPFHSHQTLYWRTLSSYIPASFSEPRRFYSSFGTIVAFHLICTSPTLKRILRHDVFQYLGRISFAMYLTHAFLLHTVGYAMFSIFWSVTGVETTLAREIGFLGAAGVSIAVIICASDIFWRAIDEWCVRMGKRIEKAVLTQV